LKSLSNPRNLKALMRSRRNIDRKLNWLPIPSLGKTNQLMFWQLFKLLLVKQPQPRNQARKRRLREILKLN